MPLLYADGIVQSAFTEITTNTTTTSTTYVALMSLSITTGTNSVIVQFSVSCGDTAATQWTEFQLLVDGVAETGTAVFSTSSGNGNSGAIVYKTAALTAGSHTFDIQWHVGVFAAGTGSVNPVGVTTDHAILVLEEVTV